MDVLSFKLRPLDAHVRARVVDAGGERAVDLGDEAAARVFVAAAGLMAAVAERVGALRALSVDFTSRTLRASLGPGSPVAGARLVGADFAALTTAMTAVARAISSELWLRRPEAGLASEASAADFWGDLYRARRDGWELGRAAPPLARYFAAAPPTDLRALVVGCGRGHEARLLARAGARVVAIDFAAEAITAARALADAEGTTVDFRVRDLFAVPRDPERYDLVVEHTCFCAIDPARRADYVAAMADVLAPGGELVGLFYGHGRAGGPPHAVARDELVDLFTPRFRCAAIEVPPDSVATRAGEELLARFVRLP